MRAKADPRVKKMNKATIHEIEDFHNRFHVFRDRESAGKTLGGMMESEYGGRDDVAVLAIPAGGVPVALQVRSILNASFDLIISRKLKVPGNPESGFGALSLGGEVFLNRSLVSDLRIEEEDIEAEISAVKVELDKRNHLFRKGRSFPDLNGKVVVIVDDGLASGYTMLASINMVKGHGARKIVVAVPTASLSTLEKVRPEADEVFCPNIREGAFFAVADAYTKWVDLDEDEVVRLLAGAIP